MDRLCLENEHLIRVNNSGGIAVGIIRVKNCGWIPYSLLQFLEVDDLSIDDSDAVQTRVRKGLLSLYKRRGLITAEDAENLKNCKGGGGFSVNADVCIDSGDRKGLERLLRSCARPAFSGEKLTAISTLKQNPMLCRNPKKVQ